ncbi:unnamed protein product [Leptosia nina]|uniref:Hemolin n=1 Tax=Leptosia nina TaxID=320188 RepID=A0AAV1JE68_9NEOP
MYFHKCEIYAVASSTRLHLRHGAKVNLPRFVGPGSNVTVALGREATLTCKVDNLQSFKVAWLRVDTQTILTIAGHVITKNHRVSVNHGDGTWSLLLREVSPGDGGRYMCQINTEPMMSQTHILQVVVPPDIDDEASSRDIIIKEGQNAALRCVASGTPSPNVAWRREDSRHFKIDNVTLISKSSGEWLNLTGVERTTSGAYLCIASNGVPPSVSKRIILHVVFAPSVWTGRVAIRALSGTSVSLQCTAEAYPVPQTYWVLNGEQRLVNGTKYRVSRTSRGYRHTATLVVSNMSRDDAGSYRCHVENSAGKAHADVFLHSEYMRRFAHDNYDYNNNNHNDNNNYYNHNTSTDNNHFTKCREPLGAVASRSDGGSGSRRQLCGAQPAPDAELGNGNDDVTVEWGPRGVSVVRRLAPPTRRFTEICPNPSHFYHHVSRFRVMLDL